MLIVIGMATIFGAIKGFAWQVASLASIIVSYIVAYRFRFDVAEMIHAKPPWNQFLAMLILYVGTSFVIWVGFRLLSSTIDRVRLKEFDRHLGAAFGLAKGLVYCLLITMFATSLLGPNQQAAICKSRSGYYIAKALDNGMGILPKEIHDVVGPYLARLDNKLKDGGADTSAADPLWPAGLEGGIPGLPTDIPSGFQAGIRDTIRQGISEVMPGVNTQDPNLFPNGFPSGLPGEFNPNDFTPGSLDPGSLFPQAGQPNNNEIYPAPQVYPPLGQPGSGLRPSSGLRPAQPTDQQAQQSGYALPR